MSTVYGIIECEEGRHKNLEHDQSETAGGLAPVASVRQLCVWAGVSRSGYHAWRQHVPSATAIRRGQLTAVVTAIFTESDSTYGYRRVHAEAARRGWHADPHTIRAIMAEEGLEAVCSRKRGPKTTIPAAGDFPDLLQRDFTAEQVGVKLVGDITYIDTWDGWVYLATVLDCASKKVVGYALADHMRAEHHRRPENGRPQHHHPTEDHDLPLRPRQSIHVRRLRETLRSDRYPTECRADRHLSRQRVG